MSQISIIKKSDIQEARRFDAEYLNPSHQTPNTKTDRRENTGKP